MADLILPRADEPEVIDKLVSFDEDHANNQLVIKHAQEIPDEHISALKRDKIDSLHTPMGNFYKFASIPIAVVEKWDREGFHIEEHNAHEIIQRLNKESLDAFITTNKRL